MLLYDISYIQNLSQYPINDNHVGTVHDLWYSQLLQPSVKLKLSLVHMILSLKNDNCTNYESKKGSYLVEQFLQEFYMKALDKILAPGRLFYPEV